MILRARLVVPVSRRPIVNGAVEVRRDRIVRVGAWRDFSEANPKQVIDLGAVALLPGLVNAHCHLDYTDLGGEFLSPKHFSDWLKLIVTAKGLSSNADYTASWKRGAKMLLRTGTTTVADIEAVPALLPRVWNATPLRIISFLEMTGVNSRRAPKSIIGDAARKIRSLPINGRHSAGMSPHAPYSTTPELLRRAAQAARKHRWLVTTHVAESTEESEMFSHARGRMHDWLRGQRDCSDCGSGTPVEALARAGLLGRNFLAIHANNLAHGDIRLLARKKSSVVHCPRSHSFFSHARFPFKELIAAGVNVCLGTDSLASIEARRKQPLELDMFAEMRAFARKNPGVQSGTILQLATINGARALSLRGKIGELTKGALADIIALPCDEKLADLYDALLHHTGEVSASLIGGQWAVQPR
jgi:cytosine/adenosine deaminase-related metal-dependent hydrolase